MAPVFTESRHSAEFILAEANGNRSRDNGLIIAAAVVLVGTVLGVVGLNEGVVTVGAPSFLGTGNGTLTKANPANSVTVQEGTYRIQIIDEGTNVGDFIVIRPDGTIDGVASVGAAYDGEVKFTIADGATDFTSPAAFTLAVSIAEAVNARQYGPLDLAATTGVEVASAIALYPVATDDTVRAISLITRDCTVNGKCLEWPVGFTDDQKISAIAQLAARGIIVR